MKLKIRTWIIFGVGFLFGIFQIIAWIKISKIVRQIAKEQFGGMDWNYTSGMILFFLPIIQINSLTQIKLIQVVLYGFYCILLGIGLILLVALLKWIINSFKEMPPKEKG